MEQIYTVSQNGAEKTIALNVYQQSGWVYLDRLHFVPGECTILLSDEGNSGQVIYGDAVKWVFQE